MASVLPADGLVALQIPTPPTALDLSQADDFLVADRNFRHAC